MTQVLDGTKGVLQTYSSVIPSATEQEKIATSAPGDDFTAVLEQFLKGSGEDSASEEELFAALARERVTALKGEEGRAKFDEMFATQKSRFTKSDGFVAYEAATLSTLRELTESGMLTSGEGNSIYSIAFAGAQLDTDTAHLWDRRGGAGDPSMTVEKMEAALASAKLKITAFADGSAEVAARSLNAADGGQHYIQSVSSGAAPSTGVASGTVTPAGKYVDGTNGFLFKPISSNEGRLAVLLPESLAHLVDEVVLKDRNGKVLDRGRSTGYGDTGEREKFAFSRKGGSYPKNLSVEVHLSDGSTVTYKIPDPSQRYD